MWSRMEDGNIGSISLVFLYEYICAGKKERGGYANFQKKKRKKKSTR